MHPVEDIGVIVFVVAARTKSALVCNALHALVQPDVLRVNVC
jgi:hypothetical protein